METAKPPIKKAVALSYDAGQDAAPKIVAKGKGVLAERIEAIAKENHILIHQDKSLADYLSALDLNQEIPPELYSVVAEILAFIYRADNDYKG
ncbi:MAG: EscU/YscU/HrcU family type III secretion system export apparatus switch protein [Syntrophomonadaceae bacterium]|jgi:flagellar biosynthesis protein|nr:EscU/YscU/HrcU family type III secretion system export apparatus switch protein [Syntrophomonadaceae bacterium]